MEALAVKVCLPSTSNAGIYWCLEGKASVAICLLGLKPPGFLFSGPSGLLENSKGGMASLSHSVYQNFSLFKVWSHTFCCHVCFVLLFCHAGLGL